MEKYCKACLPYTDPLNGLVIIHKIHVQRSQRSALYQHSTPRILRTYIYRFAIPRHPGCFCEPVFTVKRKPTIFKFCYTKSALLRFPCMYQVMCCRPLAIEVRFQPHTIQCEICGERSGIGTGLPPRTSAFLCRYNSKNAPQLPSSQRGKFTKPGNLQTKRSSFGYRKMLY